MTLDSDYDKQTFIVQGTGPDVQTPTFLSFVHEPSLGADDKRKCKLRFELPITSEADRRNRLIQAALVAAPPAVAALLGIYAAGKFSWEYVLPVVVVYFGVGALKFMVVKQK